MWIPVFLYLLSRLGVGCTADATAECQILQTTDARTPCYILIRDTVKVPPFLYMLNIPRASEQFPCPAYQTLDPTLTCYQSYPGPDPPAFILNAPLPPGADELDESPAGKLLLREAKANPIFKPLNSESTKFQHHRNPESPNPRNLGPPSPFLTMAVFKPLAPSPRSKDAPIIRSQSSHDSPSVSRVPHRYQTKYSIIHYNSPPQTLYRKQHYSTSTTFFSYPAGKVSSSETFSSPYPPSF